MLSVVAWIIEVLGLGVEAYAIIRLAALRHRLRDQKNWRNEPGIRKWDRIGSIGYGVAIVNGVTFVVAGTPLPGLYLCAVSLVLILPLVIFGRAEGEGAGE